MTVIDTHCATLLDVNIIIVILRLLLILRLALAMTLTPTLPITLTPYPTTAPVQLRLVSLRSPFFPSLSLFGRRGTWEGDRADMRFRTGCEGGWAGRLATRQPSTQRQAAQNHRDCQGKRAIRS